MKFYQGDELEITYAAEVHSVIVDGFKMNGLPRIVDKLGFVVSLPDHVFNDAWRIAIVKPSAERTENETRYNGLNFFDRFYFLITNKLP